MEAALKTLESSGGYAILFGIFLLGLFYLLKQAMAEQGRRSSEREAQIRADNVETLERERGTTKNYHDLTDRMIDVVEGNTGAITTLVEAIRPMSDTLVRIDRHMGSNGSMPDAPARPVRVAQK